MKPAKPTLTNIQKKANEVWFYLKEQYPRYCTKEEIGNVIGCKNERSVRDVISLLSTRVPIIANSSTKGYKLARTAADIEEVRHTWAETSSRIEELTKKEKVYARFIDKMKEKQGTPLPIIKGEVING